MWKLGMRCRDLAVRVHGHKCWCPAARMPTTTAIVGEPTATTQSTAIVDNTGTTSNAPQGNQSEAEHKSLVFVWRCNLDFGSERAVMATEQVENDG